MFDFHIPYLLIPYCSSTGKVSVGGYFSFSSSSEATMYFEMCNGLQLAII